MSHSDHIITIPVDARHELRFSLESHRGHVRFQQRIWFAKEGGWRPGEGVELPLDLLSSVIAGLQTVRAKTGRYSL